MVVALVILQDKPGCDLESYCVAFTGNLFAKCYKNEQIFSWKQSLKVLAVLISDYRTYVYKSWSTGTQTAIGHHSSPVDSTKCDSAVLSINKIYTITQWFLHS